MNCGAALTGPFCAACGQHAHESARSLGALFHDAWHVVTHIDSRFWRTMYLLLLRPGQLTLEYFAERRARYLPPVRVYLVISLLFFTLASLGPRSLVEPGSSASTVHPKAARSAQETPSPATHPVGVYNSDVNAGFVFDNNDCDKIKSSLKWLEKPLRQACERHVATGDIPVRDAFVANIPKMMFVFLPLMALVMLPLYWRPRRYYVEHLVFFLHTHAAMFLILLLERALAWITAALAGLRPVGGFVVPAAGIYAIWYVYRAMRIYYGQDRWFTVTKFLVVGFAYTAFLAITLVATLVISTLTA